MILIAHSPGFTRKFVFYFQRRTPPETARLFQGTENWYDDPMTCRQDCAACCIVISITSSLPGMPAGKPAGVRCINLTNGNACRIHETAVYPDFCRGLAPSREMCGTTPADAFAYLARLEELTEPGADS
jgi:uncharacterized protein